MTNSPTSAAKTPRRSVDDIEVAITAYLDAVDNEAAMDAQILARESIAGPMPPRPFKIIRHIRRRPGMVRLATRMAIAGFAPFSRFYLWRQRARFARAISNQRALRPAVGNAIVEIAPHIETAIRDLPMGESITSVLRLPDYGPFPLSVPLPVISVLDSASPEDLDWAYRAARIAAKRLCAAARASEQRLQFYTALPWLLTWRVLPRITEGIDTLYFTSQSDRWAMLFDRAPLRCRTAMVQHGFLFPLEMPALLHEIDLLFHYGEDFVAQFRDWFFAPNCMPQMQVMQPSLTLSPIERTPHSRGAVLLIGQTHYYSLDAEIATILACKAPQIDLVFKPHPTFPDYPRDRFPHECLIITQSNFFPDVDVVGSAGSWLGVQYRSEGITFVSYEAMNAQDAAVAIIGAVHDAALNRSGL